MYIEFVIADNFLLTYLAGATASALAHKRANVWRLLAAATVGTAVAVFYPYFKLGFLAQLSVKITLWLTLCVIIFVKTPRLVTSSLLFLGCTFAYGGASYALGLMLCSNASGASEFCRKCPLFFVLGCGSAVYLCARYIVKKLRLPHARAPYEYGTDVEIFGKTLHFEAFLDTGNCVFDGKTGLPVVITDAERFASKLDIESSREFLKRLREFRQITVKTPAGAASAYVIKPTNITVYSDRRGHKIDAMVGLVGGGNFSAAHEMLLNPAVIAEGI